jgi:hypothetical protein
MICLMGFGFANKFDTLLGDMERASRAVAQALLMAGYLLWRRQKARSTKHRRARHAA